MLELATGRFPYASAGARRLVFWDLLHHIVENRAPTTPDVFSPGFRDFIGACLQKGPEARRRPLRVWPPPALVRRCVVGALPPALRRLGRHRRGCCSTRSSSHRAQRPLTCGGEAPDTICSLRRSAQRTITVAFLPNPSRYPTPRVAGGSKPRSPSLGRAAGQRSRSRPVRHRARVRGASPRPCQWQTRHRPRWRAGSPQICRPLPST